MATWTFTPCGIAAIVVITDPDGKDHDAIFMSHETGIRLWVDKPLSMSGLPEPVQASVEQHFKEIFSLAHEHWTGPGPSPRSCRVVSLTPWTIDI